MKSNKKALDTLPVLFVKTPKLSFFPEIVYEVNFKMRQEMGAFVHVLRHLYQSGDWNLIEFEVDSSFIQPEYPISQNYHWRAADSIKDPVCNHEGIQTAFTHWQEEQDSHCRADCRPDWEERGWYEQASFWICRQLCLPLNNSAVTLKQIKGAWSRSYLIKIQYNCLEYFFKADKKSAPYEARLLQTLHQNLSGYTPSLVAVDTQRNWFITRKFNGCFLDDCDSPPYETVLTAYAKLQIESSSYLQLLSTAGCPYIDACVLMRELGLALKDTDRMSPCLPPNATCLQELSELLPAIEQECHLLFQNTVPICLHNEDFRSANVVVSDKILFFDWSNAALTHPFLSLCNFILRLNDDKDLTGDWTSGFSTLWNFQPAKAYLQQWSYAASPAELVQMLNSSWRIYPVYELIRCYKELCSIEQNTPWYYMTMNSIPEWINVVIHVFQPPKQKEE